MRSIIFLFAVLASCVSTGADAFSRGSTVCEVNSLPFVRMSKTLTVPAPSGWELHMLEPTRYVPGQAFVLGVRHADASKKLRGVLIWAKTYGVPSGQDNGRFINIDVGEFQFITGLNNCSDDAVTHTNASGKAQNTFTFEYQPPSQGFVEMRAFIIEDCDAPAGGCLGAQALTPLYGLQPQLFFNDFESFE